MATHLQCIDIRHLKCAAQEINIAITSMDAFRFNWLSIRIPVACGCARRRFDRPPLSLRLIDVDVRWFDANELAH